MFKALLFLGLAVVTSLAYEEMTPVIPVIFERRIVEVPCSESGRKDCGSGCIPLSAACCPDGSGGCPTATTYCQVGSNGQYGCCQRGKVCVGAGGANTFPGGIIVTTTTLRLTDEPTVFESTSASTSTFTVDIPDVPTETTEATTTTTTTPAETTVTSDEANTSFAAAPTSSPNQTSTQAPPVTVNAALSYGASIVKAATVAVMALLAI